MKDWIIIDGGVIQNGTEKHRVIQHSGPLHFCSKECLVNFFFKNIPDYNELRMFYFFFKGGAGINEDSETLEFKKKFNEFCKEKLRNYDEMIPDLKLLLD